MARRVLSNSWSCSNTFTQIICKDIIWQRKMEWHLEPVQDDNQSQRRSHPPYQQACGNSHGKENVSQLLWPHLASSPPCLQHHQRTPLHIPNHSADETYIDMFSNYYRSTHLSINVIEKWPTIDYITYRANNIGQVRNC